MKRYNEIRTTQEGCSGEGEGVEGGVGHQIEYFKCKSIWISVATVFKLFRNFRTQLSLFERSQLPRAVAALITRPGRPKHRHVTATQVTGLPVLKVASRFSRRYLSHILSC